MHFKVIHTCASFEPQNNHPGIILPNLQVKKLSPRKIE